MNVPHFELRKIREALHAGHITHDEYHYYLKHKYGADYAQYAIPETAVRRNADPIRGGAIIVSKPHHHTALYALLFMLLLGSMGIVLFGPGFSPVGLATFVQGNTSPEVLNGTFTENFTIDIDGTVGGVRLTGKYAGGPLQIILTDGTESYTIVDYDPSQYVLSTDKAAYAVGETVVGSVTPTPDDVAYYVHVLDHDDLVVPSDGTYTVEYLGSHRLDAIVGAEKLSTTFVVVNDTNATNVTTPVTAGLLALNATCGDACDIELDNAWIEVVMSDGELVLGDAHLISPGANTPPEQVAEIPSIAVDGSTTVNLAPYFTDGDGDDLVFDINNIVGVDEEIDGGSLLLTGTIPGTYTATVYVSDLQALIQSNEFTITVLGTVHESNTTNETETNTTTVETVPDNTTGPGNETVNETLPLVQATDCNDPNPNMRPVTCLQEGANYFLEQILPIEDKNRNLVGKFTPIGNLQITGDVIQYSTASPNRYDWQIGYLDEFSDFHATVWISTETGDLHMKGVLTEANTNLVKSEGMFGMTNKRGIMLAVADTANGDLTVRGNVIPYRRSLE